MKRSNRSRAYALLTTASLAISSLAVFPAVNTYAAETQTKSAVITLSENWSNSIDFSDVDTENGAYRTLYSDVTESGNYEFNPGDNESKILSALKAQTGDSIDSLYYATINDITVNYSWTYASDNAEKDVSIDFAGSVGGMDSSDEWQYGQQDLGKSGQYGMNVTERSGNASIKCSDVAKSINISISNYKTIALNMALWSNDTSDKVTLKVSSVSLDISYKYENIPSIEFTYEQLKNAKYLEITYGVPKKTECDHDAAHIGDDGQSYFDSYTYCPWAGVNVRRFNSNGVDYAPDDWQAVSTGEDKAEITTIVKISDITAMVGNLQSGDSLRFKDEYLKSVKLIDSMPDIQLGKGKIDSMKIEESYDWDAELGSVPSGKPDILPSIQIANNANEVSFKDFSAIKIDYTLGDPDAVSGIVVTLHGWEENSVGWLPKYYAADGKSGSVIIDLSQYQDKTYHNIYVGPAAPTTAKIGDDFSPYFEITDAKILSSYSGSFTKEIPPIEIKDSAIDENRPSNPSQTVTPAQPDSKTNEEKVNDAVNDAKDNSDVKISVGKGDTKIDAKIFIDAKNKGLTLEITLNNGVTWVISSDNITDDAASVDIDVKLKTKYIPKKEVEAIANGNDSMQVSLSHNGNFGFNADLKIPVSKRYENMYANLFHYYNGQMLPMASEPVKGSNVTLPFSHASEYVIVFSEEPMIEDIASAEGAYAENGTAFDAAENSAPTAVIFTAVFTVLAAAGFIAVRKIRQK